MRPEVEVDIACEIASGCEPSGEVGLIRCHSHGFPSPLARWHCHEEYELHLIAATSGEAFVGDWIGTFDPGHLVLCGPFLPHHWVSRDAPPEGVSQRDLTIHFSRAPIFEAAEKIPEFVEAVRLLEIAQHGIEFFGMGASAEKHWKAIHSARGLKRFALFCDLLVDLAQCADYRLLSGVRTNSCNDIKAINDLAARVAIDPSRAMSTAEMAGELGMDAGRFGRLFRRSTGYGFVSYLNRVRVNRACFLLMQNERHVVSICYEVGFNNLSNFNRKFLEIKGVTPTEYRKRSQRRHERGGYPAT
jgi:AraC-like DNA-binding protein